MKKLLVLASLLALTLGGNPALAQVPESAEWSTKIKAEGLGHSQIEELSQFMTDYLGSRLTASQQKRRADALVVEKLKAMGLSNPRSEFAAEFTRGG